MQRSWGGWFKFMKRSDVESGYLIDGCVTFLCGIAALDVDDDRISVPASDLGEPSRPPAGPAVGGETFHAAVLAARSPVFRAQLFVAMADARMDRITVDGVQPAAFRILLRFVYTDALSMGNGSEIDSSSLSTELLKDLLAAADMYHLDRLKLMCAQKLWDRVSVETVAATLGCADTHNCPELKKKCIDFVMVDKIFKKVALTEGYLQLMQSFPSVMDEIRARVR
ncbi:BTB/POZ and MATH domain-containing protein 3-like [Miscanthus floridulus]|uniref:BTB/POZ and MATH domain-containing protein 3-like n=1 Tax=Miscanthus floridulus TaxID=154761 RepID=UPI00345A901B